jgi:outer membrane protein OmpA-like peptidoglycan-associated protein/opacity protein-like surface antigen
MKKFNLLLTALIVLFLSSTVLNAQNKRDPWAISVGAHAVDYTSVRGVGNEFFNYNNYSIVPPLSKLSIIRNLNSYFDVDLTASVGEIDNDRLRIKDEFFVNAGLGLRFKILKGESWFDPYLRIGANYNHYDFTSLGDVVPAGFAVYQNHEGNPDLDAGGNPIVVDYLYQEPKTAKDHFGVSGGAGINFWFTKNLGLNIASDYNWIPSTKTDYFDFFQHTVGVTFRFGNKDRDGDGINDDVDDCPDTPGIPSDIPGCNGCPDSDGDGLCDVLDECPNEAGPMENNGCPILDRDGDGILDVDDDCPDTPGVASSIPGCNGCPDSDGDGVCDGKDECPNEFGTVENNGCPEMADPCTDMQAIKDALKNVLFEYNSDKLTAESMATLDNIAPLLTSKNIKNPHWLVEGHTDNVGSQNYNLPLSEKRANSVKNYLVSKGVSSSILKAVGFGLALPVTTNDTAEGRARNRRVEMKYADANFNPAALQVTDDCANVQMGDLAKMIYFKTASSDLVEASKQSLDVIAQYLNNVTGTYEIQGHTDDVGNDANNMKLSQKRAQSVVDYLISKGVNGSRLKAVGYGESAPKFDNKTADGRAQNRRIEIVQQ